MRIILHIRGLDDAIKKAKLDETRGARVKRNVLREAGFRTKRYAKMNIKSRYGGGSHSENLRGSIYMRTTKNFVSVTAGASYAGYVEYGTKPSIKNYPRNVYIAGVGWRRMDMHPGAQGYPSQHFMTRAVVRVEKEFDDIIKIQIKKVYGGK